MPLLAPMDFVHQVGAQMGRFTERERNFLISKEYIVNTKLYFLRDVLRRDAATRVVYGQDTPNQLPETHICLIEWRTPGLEPAFHNLKKVTWFHEKETSFLDKCLGKLFASPSFCKVLGATVETLPNAKLRIISFPETKDVLPPMDFDEDNRAKFRLLQCLHFGACEHFAWFDDKQPASFQNLQYVSLLAAQITSCRKNWNGNNISALSLPNTVRTVLFQILNNKSVLWDLTKVSKTQKKHITAGTEWYFPHHAQAPVPKAKPLDSYFFDEDPTGSAAADTEPQVQYPSQTFGSAAAATEPQVHGPFYGGQLSVLDALDSPPFDYAAHATHAPHEQASRSASEEEFPLRHLWPFDYEAHATHAPHGELQLKRGTFEEHLAPLEQAHRSASEEEFPSRHWSPETQDPRTQSQPAEQPWNQIVHWGDDMFDSEPAGGKVFKLPGVFSSSPDSSHE